MPKVTPGAGWARAVPIEAIQANYPHRIAADPTTCPVCCGDRITNDPRFGGARSARGWEPAGPWFECRACEPWAAHVRGSK